MASAFAMAFRAHVVPRLQQMCRIQGALIHLRLASWSEGYDAVWAIARQRGAYHLSRADMDSLLDWIGVELLREIDAAERRTPIEPAWTRLAHDLAGVKAWQSQRKRPHAA